MNANQGTSLPDTSLDRILTHLIFALAAAIGLYLLGLLWFTPDDRFRIGVTCLILVVVAVARMIQVRAGRSMAAWILLGIIWLVTAVPAAWLGGSAAAGLMVLPMLSLLAGLLLGGRGWHVFLYPSVALVVALIGLQISGRLPTTTVSTSWLQYLIVYALTFGLTVFIYYLIRERETAVVLLSTQSRTELAALNHQLQLEVAERNATADAERTQRRIAESLAAVTLALGSTLDRQEVLDLILENLASFLSFDGVAIVLLTDHGLELAARLVVVPDENGPDDGGRHVGVTWPKPLPLQARVMASQEPLYIADTEQDPRWEKLARGQRVQSWLGIPLVVHNRSIGLMSFTEVHPNAYSEDDLAVAMAFAAQAAVAIENSRLYQASQQEIRERKEIQAELDRERRNLAQRVKERTNELERQYRWQNVLGTLEPIINNPRLLRKTLDRICTLAEQEFSTAAGVMIVVTSTVEGILGDERHDLSIAARSESLLHADLDDWLTAATTAAMIHAREMLVVADTNTGAIDSDAADADGVSADSTRTDLRALSVFARERGLGSLIALPLIWQEDALGILCVLGRAPYEPAVEQLAYLRSLTNRAAVALMNVSLYQTMQAANREYQRVLALKDEFMAGMSHELRTPLNAILGLTESMQDGVYGDLTPRQHRALDNIQRSGRHLYSLITDTLDFAKIEAGEMTFDVLPVSVREVCSTSLEFVRQMADKKQLTLTYTPDAGVSRLLGDERRLTQIMVNLLTNAIKFTPAGGQVGLRVDGDVDADQVTFTVWDTGIGIEAEHLPRLFEPFTQVDSGLSRQFEGTGLGLTLVKRMAEMQGGLVEVESQPGQGSRFRVRMPWDAAADPARIPS